MKTKKIRVNDHAVRTYDVIQTDESLYAQAGKLSFNERPAFQFFLENDYTTYFTLQQALNELLDAGLVKKETIRNSSRYEITKEGLDTLDFLKQDFPCHC